MSFGERLAAAIKKAGMSQAAFGRELGVTPPAVTGWVKGTHAMSVELIPKAAKVLGVDVETVADWVHESLLEDLGVTKPSKRSK